MIFEVFGSSLLKIIFIRIKLSKYMFKIFDMIEVLVNKIFDL